jgi:hypothetical protein
MVAHLKEFIKFTLDRELSISQKIIFIGATTDSIHCFFLHKLYHPLPHLISLQMALYVRFWFCRVINYQNFCQPGDLVKKAALGALV